LLETFRRENDLEVAKLGEPGAHGDVTSPEQPTYADSTYARLEHQPIDATSGKVDIDVVDTGECVE